MSTQQHRRRAGRVLALVDLEVARVEPDAAPAALAGQPSPGRGRWPACACRSRSNGRPNSYGRPSRRRARRACPTIGARGRRTRRAAAREQLVEHALAQPSGAARRELEPVAVALGIARLLESPGQLLERGAGPRPSRDRAARAARRRRSRRAPGASRCRRAAPPGGPAGRGGRAAASAPSSDSSLRRPGTRSAGPAPRAAAGRASPRAGPGPSAAGRRAAARPSSSCSSRRCSALSERQQRLHRRHPLRRAARRCRRASARPGRSRRGAPGSRRHRLAARRPPAARCSSGLSSRTISRLAASCSGVASRMASARPSNCASSTWPRRRSSSASKRSPRLGLEEVVVATGRGSARRGRRAAPSSCSWRRAARSAASSSSASASAARPTSGGARCPAARRRRSRPAPRGCRPGRRPAGSAPAAPRAPLRQPAQQLVEPGNRAPRPCGRRAGRAGAAAPAPPSRSASASRSSDERVEHSSASRSVEPLPAVPAGVAIRPAARQPGAGAVRSQRRPIGSASHRPGQPVSAVAPPTPDRSLLSRRCRCRPSSRNSTADAIAAGDSPTPSRPTASGMPGVSRIQAT